MNTSTTDDQLARTQRWAWAEIDLDAIAHNVRHLVAIGGAQPA